MYSEAQRFRFAILSPREEARKRAYTSAMLLALHEHVRASRHLVVLTLIVALFHALVFFGVAWAIASKGGSMEHLVQAQDAGEFITLAYTLIHNQTFVFWGGEPETFRTIGYPAAIAGVLLLAGGAWSSIFIFHAILLGITAGLTAWLAEAIGIPRRGALAAGGLFGASSGPFLLNVSGMGSDILYTALYAFAACFLWANAKRPALQYALAIGIISGLATLSRPIGILGTLPLFAGIIFLSEGGAFRRIKEHGFLCALALLAFFITLTPWMTRNAMVAGHFSLSSLPTYNFVYYNMPLFLSFYNQTPEEEERNKILDALGRPNLMTLRGYAYSAELSALQKDFLKEHVVPYAAFHLYKMIPFFLGSGFNVAHAIIAIEAPDLALPLFPKVQENLTSEALRGNWRGVIENLSQFWVVTIERLVWAFVFFLAGIAPFFARGRVRLFLLLATLIIFANAFLTSPVIQPRYRTPAEPFMWVAALYTAHALYVRWRARRKTARLS